MAAVMIPEEHYPLLSAAMVGLKSSLGVPKAIPLHWNQHVKTHPRRQYVTNVLSNLPHLIVNYVIFQKASIPAMSGIHGNVATFYNYVAGIMMERLLLAAEFWPGGNRDLKVDFGHVRAMNHTLTLDYFQIKKNMAAGPAKWSHLYGTPGFLAMNANSGLQAADQYAGMLSAAMIVDQFGGYEPNHLMRVRHQIRRSPAGNAMGYGFKVMTLPGAMQSYPWWPAGGI